MCVCVGWGTDQSDKQQCRRCHREPVISFQIPSSHYGLTSSDNINKQLLLQLKYLDKNHCQHAAGVCGTYLKKETGSLSWTGRTTVVNFLEHTNIYMKFQLSWAGPDGGQGNINQERKIRAITLKLC